MPAMPLFNNLMEQKWGTAEKHEQFRNSIRAQHRQSIKITRRKQMYRYEQTTSGSEPIYRAILTQPLLLFSERQKYLQMLREVLNSDSIGMKKHTEQMKSILTCVIKFYFETQTVRQYCYLVMECLALLFYHLNESGKIVEQAIQLCLVELNRSKSEGQALTNRSLITLENITATDHAEVCYAALQQGVLEQIDILLEEFPVNDLNKCHTIGILGNLIEYLLSASEFHYKIECFLRIMANCLTENQNEHLQERAVQIYQSLVRWQHLALSDITGLEEFLFNLTVSDKYINNTEKLVINILEKMQSQREKLSCLKYRQLTSSAIVPYMQSIMVSITAQNNACCSFLSIVQADKLLLLVNQQVFEEDAVAFKNSEIAVTLFDNYIEIEDDWSMNEETQVLEFLQICLGNRLTLHDLLQQNNHMHPKNSLGCPTWEIMQQFLVRVNLQKSEKMYWFTKIMSTEYIQYEISENFREAIHQKLEECFYHQDANISAMAGQALAIWDS